MRFSSVCCLLECMLDVLIKQAYFQLNTDSHKHGILKEKCLNRFKCLIVTLGNMINREKKNSKLEIMNTHVQKSKVIKIDRFQEIIRCQWENIALDMNESRNSIFS